ncbi:class C sortase [Streptococcus gallolyticus subsp. gallolyticus]|uniref:class C sortase n=1 Tax=Streptococcus gallolyticus TaxID=315405 RepID=UPI0005C474ED|nr:class C sortase [Streptococcus gallolyticus]KJE99499.1 sortase [Streptococcus gallolyticus subsp. gallolyticus]MCF1635086.1 class C sortase [Streptococcus gallolyticus]MCY7156919.1 class C sortase [Streptococcus gallolyticus subsp. gallolyticus]MCY7179133.1 class C sortase [Streptococcus gallolyticus subsp. gallolyticus]MCY7193685.1 class C sortase [Streptococcus gallolyticus subsp. gallolyticus]
MIKKIKEHYLTVILVSMLLIGLSLVLYPTISNYWNSLHQSRIVAGYVQDVEDMSDENKADMLAAAQAYNQTLRQGVTPGLDLSNSEIDFYNKTLDVSGTGIMAYVEIPKLNTILPIYHGTDEGVLRIAIGHIPGTSLPVGGKGTHAVISGHRGLPSAKLFTNIDRLAKGDTFMIQVLDETLTYEVDQILTVLPNDMSAVAIDPEQDYVTLVTCTPYGVNTHRLLVRGHRIPNKENAVRITTEASLGNNLLIVVAVIIAIILLIIIGIYHKLRHR